MFATHRLPTFAATAIAATGLGLAAFAGAGTASAYSSADDEFLAAISDEGISYDSARVAVSNAHYVCGAIDDGADPLDLGDEILANTDLSTHQAAVFVVESVFNYCPEHTVLLP
ncbi:DUF732 domain-containing protein [Mycolicibacterium moriokaense]|nr:DUF732 domain-containing protein [Mycolicibacterium moriokaense]